MKHKTRIVWLDDGRPWEVCDHPFNDRGHWPNETHTYDTKAFDPFENAKAALTLWRSKDKPE